MGSVKAPQGQTTGAADEVELSTTSISADVNPQPSNSPTVLLMAGTPCALRARMLLPENAIPAVIASRSAALGGAANAAIPPTTKNAPASDKATAPARRLDTRSPNKKRPPSTDHTGAK